MGTGYASQQATLCRHAGSAGQQPACQCGQPAAHTTRAAIAASARVPIGRVRRSKACGAAQPRGCMAATCRGQWKILAADSTGGPRQPLIAHKCKDLLTTLPPPDSKEHTLQAVPSATSIRRHTCDPAVLQRLVGRHPAGGVPHQAVLQGARKRAGLIGTGDRRTYVPI